VGIVQNLKQKYHTVGIVQNLKQKYHTVGIVQKFNRKFGGRDKGDIFNTQIHDCLLEPYNTNV
jgi:hypothetical protein